MKLLNSLRFYTLFTGIVLFLLGFLGFAFRHKIDLPDGYLLLSLILGFWGILIGIRYKAS
ncbi:MAG TPA: hypothetical protein VE973_04090 [Candidatus Limnocylindria bacterium]|nr:hypothetical protein [Candidatus Limnocylindria bacterium]